MSLEDLSCLAAICFLAFIVWDNYNGTYSACVKRRKKGNPCHNIYCRNKSSLYELPPLKGENKPD